MALKAGRVGVLPSEVDSYGKIIGGSGGGSGGGEKLYYKDYKIANDTTSSSIYWSYVASDGTIDIEGYTPLSATVIRTDTGYSQAPRCGVSVVEGDYPASHKIRIFATGAYISSTKYGVRVYYAKNENTEVLE